MTKIFWFPISMTIILSCSLQNEMYEIVNPNIEVESFIKEYLKQSQHNVHELAIEKSGTKVMFKLRDVVNSCELNLGDEYCPFISDQCSMYPPLKFYLIDNNVILVFSGLEKLRPSKKRYDNFWKQMDGKFDRCIESFNSSDSTFVLNAPRTSSTCSWKFELIDDNKKLITYTPLDDCSHDIDSLYRLDTILISKCKP